MTTTPTTPFAGAGPGARTLDGCSVELYRTLPYLGELEDVADVLRPGERVLELGCGIGRLTRELLARGMVVTAIDNSSEMLAAVPAPATRVHADIEQLRLAERFDVALLASCLVNHPDRAVREAFLAAARRRSRCWRRRTSSGRFGRRDSSAPGGRARRGGGSRLSLHELPDADPLPLRSMSCGYLRGVGTIGGAVIERSPNVFSMSRWAGRRPKVVTRSVKGAA